MIDPTLSPSWGTVFLEGQLCYNGMHVGMKGHTLVRSTGEWIRRRMLGQMGMKKQEVAKAGAHNYNDQQRL